MSCRITSIEEFASIIPVSPPTVNRKINPMAHIRVDVNLTFDPKMVASHLKTFTPVGTAITIVAAVK